MSADDEVTDLLLKRCLQLAKITEEPGCITRPFLSDAMDRANAMVATWMGEAGLQTELDGTGNLIGILPAEEQDAPVLVLGSHLDTVRDAGAYDGVLGVLLALAVVEDLKGEPLPFNLEVVAFSDEEGLRYGVPFLGSQALIGEFDPALLARRDAQGISMEEAIRSWGGDPDAIRCRYDGRQTLGYIEAHIEQGPWLEHRNLSVGVLEALSGSCWMNLRFFGQAGHAGTTPMELRLDPIPAAAEVVLAVERLAEDTEGMVATVGKLRPTPGVGNVIARCVEWSVDIRHPDSCLLTSAVGQLLDICRGVAARRGLRFEHEVLYRQDGVEADPRLSQILAEAAAVTGHDVDRLLIGAGHDALIMSRIMPMAMLMLRSPGGISHHPDEAVLPEDVTAARQVLNAFVRRLASLEATEDTGLTWDHTQQESVGVSGNVTAWDAEG